MQETTSPENPSSNNLSVKDICNACLDSTGYAIFVVRLSNKTDAKGNLVKDLFYRRFRLSFEDIKDSLVEFKRMVLDDIKKEIKELEDI